jgi:hypothetical protein
MDAQLQLTPRIRVGERHVEGTYKSERHFLDFVVNSQSLWEALGKSQDMVSILCTEFAADETKRAVNRLLLREKADLPNERRSLFTCAECGDLGCGAITLEVHNENGKISWSTFGSENKWESRVQFDEYTEIGPFTFDSTEYERTLQQGIDDYR